jgi:5-methylcytosine-specific restriction protein A
MPAEQSSRLCSLCGQPVGSDYYPTVGPSRHKSCHNKHSEDKRKAELRNSKQGRKCAHCGNAMSVELQASAKYCSKKCKDAAEDPEKKKSRQRKYYEANKERLRAESRVRMSKLLSDDGYRKKAAERSRTWEKENPEARKRWRRTENSRRSPHNAHVKLWRKLGLDYRKPRKHSAHVSEWRKWCRSLSASDAARYYKSIGQPWRNPYLTDRAKYAIRYRLDLEYRLGEINRASWRKEELKRRDDGTQSFWLLLRERKTCPYCGTRITKENACADHMDPLKHGGANGQHNLTICCKTCNSNKSGRPFVEWIDMLPVDRRNAALRWYKRKHGHGPEQASLCFTFAA